MKYIEKEKANEELIKKAKDILAASNSYEDVTKLDDMIEELLKERNKQIGEFEKKAFGDINNPSIAIYENELTVILDLETEKIIDNLFSKIKEIYLNKFHTTKKIIFTKEI